ncbi:hypothetical protein MTR67_026542 [Solanum verrucosum]|uniref:Uncharacterized protein n=1 Tax=Solanum verrucosum TaxID=315347 RepID=A0AAF0TU20_SOLVR|nr:hypothetical protein MTR67_026542 [Solanum verrucosum]
MGRDSSRQGEVASAEIFSPERDEVEIECPSIEYVPVVSEFKEVFPIDLPGMPPNRDIDFCIDLETGTRPISIPSYRMAPAELRELLDKGFTHPIVPKWGAPILFLKKKEDANVLEFIYLAGPLQRDEGRCGGLNTT